MVEERGGWNINGRSHCVYGQLFMNSCLPERRDRQGFEMSRKLRFKKKNFQTDETRVLMVFRNKKTCTTLDSILNCFSVHKTKKR